MDYIISNETAYSHIVDGYGSTGLHLAAEFGHEKIVDLILRVRSSEHAISIRLVGGF